MKNKAIKRLLAFLGSLLIVSAALFISLEFNFWQADDETAAVDVAEENTTMDRAEKKAARWEYFFRLMRDPATNQIPENIRNRELQFSKTLPTARQTLQRAKSKDPTIQAVDYSWEQAGPHDVGGRTRALAVDQRDPDIVLAGGVSGGMWKSTDGGQTWQLRTPDLPNLSVTSIAQDPINPDTWYYSSGEVIFNSANAVGAAYYGEGIYKSTDNGDSWTLMPQASSDTRGLVDDFNTVSRIQISPTTGSIFIASTGFGIYRSTDGESFSNSGQPGTEREQLFADVAIASDGRVGAVISEADFDDQQSQDPSNDHNPGVFISDNDGDAWIEITPDDFPDTYRRSVLTFAPSNPDILYVFTLKGAGDNSNQGVSFFKIDISDPANPDSEDRSGNLPDFGEPVGGVNLQGGYNMLVSVKPDDPDFVMIGGINLFRSRNGFETAFDNDNSSQKDEFWIGGYSKDNNASQYPGQHPDQHILAFPEPEENPDLMWAGHDGGLSFTNDVTASSVNWQDLNNGYLTSQFYAVDIPDNEDDTRFIGGTQDNGTPFFRFTSGSQSSTSSIDISSGDGGYSFWENQYVFVSSQNGTVTRITIESDGDITSPFDGSTQTEWTQVQPSSASNQLFIHPYAIDPNDETTMYYPSGSIIWRNTEIDQISNFNNDGATSGWEELQNVNSEFHTITALEVSTNPGNILYFGGYSSDQQPVMKRLNNANTADGEAKDIPLPDNSNLAGAYIKDIAINPVNSNEVVVVMSNYNIVGLYHTTDGGDSWTPIEGNLMGSDNNPSDDSNPGPSLRSAAIIPAEEGTIYLLGTSTGVYSTQMLDGNNTEWGHEAVGNIGSVVVEDMATRISDGDVVAGTHGRGLFYGDFGGTTNAPFITADPLEGRAGNIITITANDFEFSTDPVENTVTFGNATARVLNATSSELQVEVPRGAVERDSESNSVIVTVETDDRSLATTFEVLPPNDFTVEQNYPNPFNPSTTIPFDIPADGTVTMTIYNINGQKVLQPIRQENYNAGSYTERIDLSGLASGVYIYRIFVEAASGGDDAMQSKQMTFIK